MLRTLSVHDPKTADHGRAIQSFPCPLASFQLLGVLGEGGSGVVYEARWGHRQVALKVLHPSLVVTEREQQRFMAEAKLLSEIAHPGVVKVLNYGTLPAPDGRPYLAMERLEGQTLAARLGRGALPANAALDLLAQMVDAVEALHMRGLVHRDLKPENIFLVGDGQYAVLLDFGIAKELDAPASTVTQDGGVRGTPAYMAPERFFGSPATPRTDIYELAVVLYTMLVGRLPWDDVADPDARLNPRMPSDVGITLPGQLETTLRQALSTRPESRPASARAFLGQARMAAAGGTSPARATASVDDGGAAPIHAPVAPGTVDLSGRGEQSRAAMTPFALANNPVTPGFQQHPASPGFQQHPASPGFQQHPASPGFQQHPASPGYQQQHGAQIQLPYAPTSPVNTPAHENNQATGDFHEQQHDLRNRRVIWPWLVAGVAVVALAVVLTVVVTGGKSGGTAKANVAAGAASGAGADSAKGQDSASASEASAANDELAAADGPAGDWKSGEAATSPTAATKSRFVSKSGGLSAAGKYHPADTMALVGIRVAELLASEALGSLIKGLASNLATNDELKPLALLGQVCNVDPLKQLDWVSVGIVPGGDDVDVVLSGSFKKKDIDTCAAGLGDSTSLFWLDSQTLFFTTRPKISKEWLADRKAARASMESEHADLLASVDRDTTVWFVGDPGEMGSVTSGLPTPKTAAASIRVAADVRGEIVLTYAKEKTAKGAVQQLNSQLADVPTGLIGELSVRQDGPRLKLHVVLSSLITSMLASSLADELNK